MELRACTWFYLLFAVSVNLIDSQEWQPPRLMWVSKREYDLRANVQSLPAEPADYILSSSISSPNHFTLYGSHWVALAEHISERAVYISDLGNRGIIKGTFTEDHVEDAAIYFIRGTSATVDGVAVDWVTGNLYWTDFYYNWIKVVDTLGERQHVIIKTGLEMPRALAVYPQRGLLFWSDWGSEPKIERATLSGESRQTLVNSGLIYPNGITIDYNTDRLYWINVDPDSYSTIKSCDLNGNSHQTIYTESSQTAWFFDLTLYQSYIFATDWREKIRCIYKNGGGEYFSLNTGLQTRPFGIKIYGNDNQPSAPSGCEGSPCSDICVSDPNGYKCLCTEGSYLLPDERTCQKDDTLISPILLWSTTDSICTLPINMADYYIPDDNFTFHCILQDQEHVTALDADVHGQFLFFSDFKERLIRRARLIDGESTEVIMGGVGSVEGIAADWINLNLYWSDNYQGHIAVSRLDGNYRKILITNLDLPRSVVVDPITKHLYWTDHGSSPKIERAGLDGNQRTVFVSNVVQPMGLAIDFVFNRVYFADSGTQSLYSVDMSGGDKQTILQQPGAQFFDIEIFQDYIFWTEWGTSHDIHFANKETNSYSRGVSHAGTAYGLRTYDETRQPLGTGPCDINNGGCQQLCLPRSTSGYICDCSTGFTVQSDGISCGTVVFPNDVILASDPYLHGIFQINLDSPSLEYSALGVDNMLTAYPHSIDVDPILQQIYWSDIGLKAIHKSNLDGTHRQTIVQANLESPVGLAVDYISGLVYWSDSTQAKIEVIDLELSNRKTITSDNIVQPKQILLHLQERYLYWSDWGGSKIERVYQDGSNRQTVISTDISRPAGLAIDYTANKLYWCDFALHKIEVCDVTGENRQILIQLSSDDEPFGLAVYGQYVYWTDWKKHGLLRADKETGNNIVSVGHQDFTILYDIHVHPPASIQTGSNDCLVANGDCSNLCFPTPTGRVCGCPDNIQMKADGITCEGVQRCPAQFLYGSVATDCRTLPGYSCNIQCDPGYEFSSTSTQITCLETGQWNLDPSTLCAAKECSALPVPSHSTTESCPQPSVYGIACVYRCDIGYVVASGHETRTCQADGSWSGELLICQVQQCPPLSTPNNGLYSLSTCITSGGVYSDVCQLSCQPGYQLQGVASRSCLATGQWSDDGSTATCNDVTPPDFGSSCPVDVTVTAPSGLLSAVVTWTSPVATDNSGQQVTMASSMESPVELDKGQHMVTFTATDSSGNSQTCNFDVTVQVLYCPQLPVPLNGYLNYPPCDMYYGILCPVLCIEGYELSGTADRRCEVDSTGQPYWTGTDAVCTVIECQETEMSMNSVKSGCTSPYTYRTECMFSCITGYYQSGGDTQRTCQADNTWSGTPIECTIETCSTMTSFPNGDISPPSCLVTGGIYGDTCHVSCNQGYRLQGASSHSCLETGQWSDPDDEHACEDVTAPHFSGTCPDDMTVYAAMGETSAAVSWTDPIVFDNSGLPLTVTTSKPNGVTLNEGQHSVVIYATDTAGNQATCRFDVMVTVIRCPVLSVPQYGSITETCTNHYGSQCHLQCNIGYSVSGDNMRTCLSNSDGTNVGYWTGDNTICQIVMCVQPILAPHSIVQGCDITQESLPYNTKCQYQCDLGYEPVSGSIERLCQANGMWDGMELICQIKSCTSLPAPVHGHVIPDSCQSQSYYGDQCVYSCDNGYQVRGILSQECLHDGTWTQSGLSTTCLDIEPPSFGSTCPEDMTVIAEPCSTTAKVDYIPPVATDNDGIPVVIPPNPDVLPTYKPVGLHSRVYTATDNVGNEQQCQFTITVQVVECAELLIDNAVIESQSCQNMYGSIARVVCDIGYRLIGDEELTCGLDGYWSGVIPYCQAITCPSLLSPDFSTIMPLECVTNSIVHYATICTVQCNTGFQLNGVSQTSCSGNGVWSHAVQHTICQDIAPPSFGDTCPPSTIPPLVLPQGSATTEASWDIPVATDNSGQVTVVGPEDPVPPINLGPGRTFFLYTAYDTAGLTTVCNFFVEVVDEEPPESVNCTEDYEISSSTMPVELHWPQPVFSDNVAVVTITADVAQYTKVFRWGVYSIHHTAYDDAGNVAYCVTNVTVTGEVLCPPLTPPSNGGLACNIDSKCTVHCDTNHFFRKKPPDIILCYPGEDGIGVWSHGKETDPAPGLPACTSNQRNRPPRWSKNFSLQFKYQHIDGECQNSINVIKKNFIELLVNAFGSTQYCEIEDYCSEDKVLVECDSDARKRRSVDQMNSFTVNFTTIHQSHENHKKFEDMIKVMTSSTNVSMVVDGYKVVLDSKNSTLHDTNVHCDSGYVPYMDTCVACPVGTYYNTDTIDCTRCPKGYYQDEEVQVICKMCPVNTTTLGDGIFTQSDCYEICQPGSFSYFGIAPCQLCPLGYYQPDKGQRSCIQCPKWHSSIKLGGTSLQDCLALIPVSQSAVENSPSIIYGVKSDEITLGLKLRLSNDKKYETLSLGGAITKP
ncbi:uncharacterized protein LOC144447400 [Glandiceps talaboti]